MSKHVDCSTFLCFNLDPNGLDMRCVECDKKIPVKSSGANAAACAKGVQGCDKAAGIVQPQCGLDYTVCNKNKEPYTCEKIKDACGGCTILNKCNEQTKKCESLFVSTNDCPTGSISYNPSSAEPNKKISFTANENDKNNDKVTCTWKDGSTKISTQCKFDYSFSLTGDHKITLEVTDGKNNCAETYSKNLQVTASESATPALQCKSNEHIIFTMSGNKDANVGTWDAGMNVQVCHKGDTGLKRDCTGNNKVLKYLTGKFIK
ncbi:PKD domain-containing protein [Candidatus Woesearchaeota archaeon]|nr:PKD domain-containing protein [Candidatus Woesearchaeota archaeon]